MGFDEIEAHLPNGLHDAEVEVITYDLLGKQVMFQVFVWIGQMSDPPNLRERYRRGLLRFTEVVSFAKSVPYDLSDSRLQILSCAQNKDLISKFRASEPSSENGYRIFTGNCEFDVEAAGCEFEWVSEEVNRGMHLLGD